MPYVLKCPSPQATCYLFPFLAIISISLLAFFVVASFLIG
jgi:hypothetical protein